MARYTFKHILRFCLRPPDDPKAISLGSSVEWLIPVDIIRDDDVLGRKHWIVETSEKDPEKDYFQLPGFGATKDSAVLNYLRKRLGA